MYSVGGSSSIRCTLSGVDVLTYAWYDEDGNTVVSGNELSYSANDSIHHKTFMCSGQNMLTSDTEAIYIKFVINGNKISTIMLCNYDKFFQFLLRLLKLQPCLIMLLQSLASLTAWTAQDIRQYPVS